MFGGFFNLDKIFSEYIIVYIYLYEFIYLFNVNYKFCKLQVVLYIIVQVYIGFVLLYGIIVSSVFGWNCYEFLSVLFEKYI